jgi:hypothetical protein
MVIGRSFSTSPHHGGKCVLSSPRERKRKDLKAFPPGAFMPTGGEIKLKKGREYEESS